MKIGGLVVDSHSEGTASQICYLGPHYHFMKCRKPCYQK